MRETYYVIHFKQRINRMYYIKRVEWDGELPVSNVVDLISKEKTMESARLVNRVFTEKDVPGGKNARLNEWFVLPPKPTVNDDIIKDIEEYIFKEMESYPLSHIPGLVVDVKVTEDDLLFNLRDGLIGALGIDNLKKLKDHIMVTYTEAKADVLSRVDSYAVLR
jgi:hypothetical protein